MAQYASVARARQTAVFTSNPGTDLLTNLLEAASAIIDSYTDRAFDSSTYSEVMDGNGLDYLFVRNPQITALTSVTVVDSGGSSYTLDTDDLDYDARTGKIVFQEGHSASIGTFLKGHLNVTIAYTGGYSTIPDEVQEACVLLACGLYAKTSLSKNPGFESERMGEHNYKRASAADEILTPAVKALLDKHVHSLL